MSQGTLGMQSRRLAKALLMDCVRRRSFLFEPGPPPECSTNKLSFFDEEDVSDDDDDFLDDEEEEDDECGMAFVRSAAEDKINFGVMQYSMLRICLRDL